MFELIVNGFWAVLQPMPLFLTFLGTFAGIMIGCIPGFTITMGVALTLPLTFGMDPLNGLCIMLGVLVGGLAGGQISGILLGIPGTPASMPTVFDGYPLTQQGKPGVALATGTWASFFGGMLSGVALMFCTPPLANAALLFGPWEVFSMVVFGLTVIVSLSSKAMHKGIISGLLGLFTACVGTDRVTNMPRFTFGMPELSGDFAFLPVLVGLFAFSQLMSNLEVKSNLPYRNIKQKYNLTFSNVAVIKDLIRQKVNLIRSSILGILVGALPGAGGSIASVLCYDQAKKASKNPEKFGTGVTEGIVASESGNNATAGGSLAPMLALGVPGDATAAIMMGALILHSIQPGPEIINKYPVLVYGVFVAFFIAHFFMLFLMLYGIRIFVHITRLPLYVLVPSVLVLCAVGAFAVKNNYFDVWTLLIFGCLGYFMGKFKYPLAPFILGVILAPLAETSLVQAVQLDSNPAIFFTRPISLGLLVCAAISLVYPFWQSWRRKRSEAVGRV